MGVLGFSLSWFIILIYNIIFILLITLVIATLTLIERKVLSLIQRRVGPNFVGYKGRLQYIADALKLFIKGIIVPNEVSKFWFSSMPACVASIIYIFWMNSVWSPSVSIFEIEYNIVYASLLSIFFGYCIMLTGYFSKSKYALMASIRSGIIMLNLEVFLGLMLLAFVFFSESFCFSVFVLLQETVWFCVPFFSVFGLIVIAFLLETNRAPFDLAEAESELVSGYNVEYGGFYFALYYLGEYFHLFFFSMVMALLVFGGWNNPHVFFFLDFYVFF